MLIWRGEGAFRYHLTIFFVCVVDMARCLFCAVDGWSCVIRAIDEGLRLL
jgi:hypothetical protein